MTISSGAIRKAGPFTANGVTVAYPFTFKVFQDSEVLVVQTDASLIETTLVLSSDYTVALNGDQDVSPGGTVNLTAAPTAGFLITIGSRVSETQPADLVNTGGFYPQVIEDSLDRVIICLQQLAEVLTRTVQVPFSSSSGDATSVVNSVLLAAAQAEAAAIAAANSAIAAANAVPSGALAYTPVNKAGDSMTGPLTVPILTVSGAATVPTPVNTDNSQAPASTAFVNAVKLLNGVFGFSTDQSPGEPYRGKVLNYTGTGGNVVTLPAIDGYAIAILNSGSGPITTNPATLTLAAGDSAFFVRDAGVWHAMGHASSTAVNVQTFTANGTWTKPAAGNVAMVEVWGAGASGAKGAGGGDGGGGGGEYTRLTIPLSSLGATETVTIGAGGAAVSSTGSGNTGGNTTFGAWLTGLGGLRGRGSSLGVLPAGGGYAGEGWPGGSGAYTDGTPANQPAGSRGFAGGGGGSNASGITAAGTSVHGGNGGAGAISGAAAAGTQPGGGGGASVSGNSGKGADGQVRVTVF